MKFLFALLALVVTTFAAAPEVSVPTVVVGVNGAATLSAKVKTNGGTTNVTFFYGIGTDRSSKKLLTLSASTIDQNATASLTGLVGEQTYHFNVQAKNTDGSTLNVDGLDFTVAAYTPTIIAKPVVQARGGKATLDVNVTGNGKAVKVLFEFGLTSAYGTTIAGTPDVLAADIDKEVTAKLEGLKRGATYHWKASEYLNGETLLSYLRGGAGVRIERLRHIRITDRIGSIFDVDLTGANTLNDITSKINTAVGSNMIRLENSQLILTDSSGGSGTFSVAALNGSNAATDLGILKSANAATPTVIIGDSFIIGGTPLSSLRSGAGVRIEPLRHIRITSRSGTAFDVNLTGATTIDDVISKINNTVGSSMVHFEDSQLILTDSSIGSETFSIAALNSSNAAADLGILKSANAATPDTITGDSFIVGGTHLSSLRSSAGVRLDPPNLNQIHLTAISGDMFDVDLTGAITVDDVIAKINTASGNTSIQVSLEHSKLILTDSSSSGVGTFSVTKLNGSDAAADLGILKSANQATPATITGNSFIVGGTLLSSLRSGEGVRIDLKHLHITARSGIAFDVDLTGATTLDNVIDIISSTAVNNAAGTTPIKIRLENSKLILTNSGSNEATFSVKSLSGFNAAADLGILKSASADLPNEIAGDPLLISGETFLSSLRNSAGIRIEILRHIHVAARNGSTFNVDLTGANTLDDVINNINAAAGSISVLAHLENSRLVLVDSNGGTGAFSITALNSSNAATDLGILKSAIAATPTIITGDTLGSTTTDTTFTATVNQSPKAVADIAAVRSHTPIFIDVLSNDSDPENDGLTLKSVTQGKQGTTEIVGRKVRYTPKIGATGPDTFTYVVSDDFLDSPATATGKVTIKAPGLAAQGLHSAVIKDEHGKVVGQLRLMGTEGGAVSGKVELYGKSFALLGTLDADGNASISVPRPGTSPLSLKLAFDQTDTASTLKVDINSGKFTAEATLSALTASRLAELQGRYTVQLPGAGGTASTLPQGTGYVRLDVQTSGDVSIRGQLGDGEKIHARAVLGGLDGAAAVNIYLAPKNARVNGTLLFGTGEDPSVTGTINWTRPARSDSDLFPDGFETSVSATGGSYIAPLKGRRALDGNDKATITLTGGNLSGPITHNLDLNSRDGMEILDPSGDQLKMKVDRGAGTFHGSFTNPTTGDNTKINGVLLQSQSKGVGVFAGSSQTGTVSYTIGTRAAATGTGNSTSTGGQGGRPNIQK